MNNLKLFGKRIKELRKNKKLTQEQLGELVGIDFKQIGNIETGTYFTTMPTLEKIAKALDVEIFELFNFNHNNSREILIENIIKMVKEASDDDLKIIYRIIGDILK
ncbi:MAG: helix-turn-helix transcriptional regulator [Cyanobacteria bacterium SIG27]|nr:helix-turn-helix transcriptional regulator [Cyanobacteria bacterium SIG27]